MQSDGHRLGKSMTHGISLICTRRFKSPPLVLWAKLYDWFLFSWIPVGLNLLTWHCHPSVSVDIREHYVCELCAWGHYVFRWTLPYLDKQKNEAISLLLGIMETQGMVDLGYREYNWNLNKVETPMLLDDFPGPDDVPPAGETPRLLWLEEKQRGEKQILGTLCGCVRGYDWKEVEEQSAS